MNTLHIVAANLTYQFGQAHYLLAQIDSSAGFKQGLGRVLGNIIYPLLFVVGVLKAAYHLYTSERNENWKAGLTTAILLASVGLIMTVSYQIFGLGAAAVPTDFTATTGQ